MQHLAPTFTEAEVPEQFLKSAYAYLEGAERLTADLASGVWPADYSRGQVALWLGLHATELFLKACLRKAPSSPIKNVHSLGELLVEFSDRYPGVEFEPPFGPAAMKADWELFEMATESDRTAHEQLRYPVSRKNAAWPGVRSFAPHLFARDLQRLRADMDRVASGIFN